MRNIYEVLREKETELQQLQKEVDALKLAARLLTDDTPLDLEPPRPVRLTPVVAPPRTDGEILMAAPQRQFP